MAEGRKLEERRIGFAAELAAALGVEVGDSTLSHARRRAARARGERAAARRRDRDPRRRDSLARRSVANRQLLEHELAVIDQVVRIAHRGDRSTYAGSGTYPRDPDRDPGRAA